MSRKSAVIWQKFSVKPNCFNIKTQIASISHNFLFAFDRICYLISFELETTVKWFHIIFSFSFTVLWFHIIFAAKSSLFGSSVWLELKTGFTREAMKEIELFSIGIPHTRKSLVKGERFMRYEWRIWVCNFRFLFWLPPFKPYQKSLNNLQGWARFQRASWKWPSLFWEEPRHPKRLRFDPTFARQVKLVCPWTATRKTKTRVNPNVLPSVIGEAY